MESQQQPNQQRFLAAYRRIEDRLRRIVRAADRSLTADQLIPVAAEHSPLVRKYQRDLHAFRNLRNSLSHDSWRGRLMVEPLPHVIHEVERIADRLETPPRLPERLLRRPRVFLMSEKIGAALEFMLENDYSQVPVSALEGELTVLTSNTISRWLAAQIAEDLISLGETHIEQVIGFREASADRLAFASASADCAECLEMLTSESVRANVLVITEDGSRTGGLLGLVTASDIPVLLDALDRQGH